MEKNDLSDFAYYSPARGPEGERGQLLVKYFILKQDDHFKQETSHAKNINLNCIF